MQTLSLDTRLESALGSPKPRLALQKLLAYLMESGYERDEIVSALESFRARLAVQSRQAEDELILELMDGFNGWCRV